MFQNKEQELLKVAAGVQGLLDADTANAIKSGNATFLDSHVIHRAEITSAASIKKLLIATNDLKVGVSDFDKDRLQRGDDMVVSKMIIAFGAKAKAAGMTADQVDFASLRANFPAALKSARIKVQQGGITKLDLPVERFVQGLASPKVTGVENAVELGRMFVLNSTQATNIVLEFPDGASIADDTTNQSWISVEFLGTKVAKKA